MIDLIEDRYWKDKKALPLNLWLRLWGINPREEGTWETTF